MQRSVPRASSPNGSRYRLENRGDMFVPTSCLDPPAQMFSPGRPTHQGVGARCWTGAFPRRKHNPYQVEAERERMNESERLSRASARRPSVVESPEFKKAKLGADSESATLGAITPGEPIFGTLEDSPDDDVEIPLSRTSDLRMSSPPRHPDPLEKTLELV